MNSRSFLLSAAIAGVIIGLLANLPILNIINCFLCLWVWVGGAAAVFIYGKFQPGGPGLKGGQGAGLGALAGLIGAFVGIFVNAATSFISVPMFNELARWFQVEGDLPFRSGGFPALFASTFFFFILDAIFYPLFGALSGWIAASLGSNRQSG